MDALTCEDVMISPNPLSETKPSQQSTQVEKRDICVGRAAKNLVQDLVVL